MEIACPAKINLALSVGAPDADGMHPIASWMVCLDLADALTLEKAEGPPSLDIRLDRGPDSMVADRQVDWPLEKDLAWRAWRLLAEHVGRELPAKATLLKRIPTGGGLGGGSADAAGMLVGLSQIFELGVSTNTLVELSRRLGSDVGFFVRALANKQPSALVTGLGEAITPLPLPRPIDLVLIFPPFGCPTGPVYQAFDQMHRLARGDARPAEIERVCQLAANWPSSSGALFNDLAEPACRVQPPLTDLRQRLADTLGRPVHVTGSGSTLFTLAEDRVDAQRLADRAVTDGDCAALPGTARP